MLHLVCLVTLYLLTFSSVGDCGSYQAPRGSEVSFPYRRVPTLTELIEDAGFKHDRYNVTTEDGHILALHRISPIQDDDSDDEEDSMSRGVPVLFINGFTFHSDGWLLLGNASLPFTLANLGYDVWLGDYRGSIRSLGHVSYTSGDYRANNYSIHELGLYDIPAFVDHILDVTERQKILYVGLSLSAAMLFVMNSELPEYNEKLLGAALMAPAGHSVKFEDYDMFYRTNIFVGSHFANGALRLGHWLTPRADALPQLKHAITFCHMPALYLQCRALLISMIGFSDSLDPNTVFYQVATGLTTSHMNIAKHLVQIYTLGRFCKYDFGFEKNLEVYGREYPPSYNLSRTTAPVFIIHGGADVQVRPQAAKRTGRQLGNLYKRKLVESFNHGDFLFGKNAPKVVYEDIIHFFDYLIAKSADEGADMPAVPTNE